MINFTAPAVALALAFRQSASRRRREQQRRYVTRVDKIPPPPPSRRALLAAAPFGIVAGVRFDPGVIGPETPGGGLIFATAIVRLYATGPVIHENSAHAQLGELSARVNDAGNLEITRTGAAGAIAYLAATIDETLAGRGIIAGASGGLAKTVVILYDTDIGRRVRCDSSNVVGPTSNLWLLWIVYPPAVT